MYINACSKKTMIEHIVVRSAGGGGMRKISLRDLARDIESGKYKRAYVAQGRGFGKALERQITEAVVRAGNQKWYVTQGFKQDVGFERLSERSRYVRCVICGHSGAGVPGTYWELYTSSLARWQGDHLAPHLFECACGRFFHNSQSLGAHVASNRRHRNDGHGRMDRVG